MIFAFYTLGCKVNQYETQAMEQELLRRGHQLGQFTELCDCYVINSCTVTAVSDKKNRAMIRQAKRRNPNAIIGVCGCYAQTQPEAVKALNVDVISGTGDRMAFLDALERAALDGAELQELVGPSRDLRSFEILPPGSLEGRTRAMLKVQDGCDNYCTYCIIPYARGPVRSLPIESAVAQLHQLAEMGYRECIITGIEIASWGKDLKPRQPMVDLIEALCAAEPQMRIRLGSLEPRVIDAAFCERLAKFDNLCPQFHLSMQSGCDATLKRMARKYDTARYYESVELLYEAFPGCSITTDLITGFPGETEEEFAETLAFMEKVQFAQMHIFPYSRRSGTRADKMPEQVEKQVKEARAARANALAEQMMTVYREKMIGQTVAVLFEQPGPGGFWGHAPNYVPVCVTDDVQQGEIKQVRITAVGDGCVIGTVIK